MTSTSTRRARPIHVHGAELSTDQDTIGTYAEAIAVLVALVVLLAAAWAVATPAADADLTVPGAQAQPTPEVHDVSRTLSSTADVYWADAFDAPAATAVSVEPDAAPVPEAAPSVGPDVG